MEILFEFRGSRRQVSVADSESVTRVLSGELQRIGKPRARVFTANDDLPNRSQGPLPDIYLLQKWSGQWNCYVDVAHCSEVIDGDRLAVIAKPKPTSKFALLCCCVPANRSSYRVGKVGGSGKNKLPKTEEIQSLEYKFRADSAAGSEWEHEQPKVAADSSNSPVLDEGEEFIRAKSGRASWKLIKNSTSSTSVTEDGDIPTSEAEAPTSEAKQLAESEGEAMQQYDTADDPAHRDGDKVSQQEENQGAIDVEQEELEVEVELKESQTEEREVDGASISVVEEGSVQMEGEAGSEMEETEGVSNEGRVEEVLVEGEEDLSESMPEGEEAMPEGGQEDTVECVEGITGNAEAKETNVNGDDGTDSQDYKGSELPVPAPDQHVSEQLDCENTTDMSPGAKESV